MAMEEKNMKRKAITVAVVLFAALGISACAEKKKEEPQITGKVTEAPAYQNNLKTISPSAYSNVKGIPLQPGTYISIIGKSTGSTYWKEVEKGVEQATKDLNKELGYTKDKKIKVSYNAPSEVEDIDQQVNILDEELARYPDALAIASIGLDACRVQLDLAEENGIPIISFDSSNTHNSILSEVSTNNDKAARTCANKISDEILETGSILIIAHDSESGTAIARENNFKDEIGRKDGAIKIADTLYLDKLDEIKKEIAVAKNKDLKQEETEVTIESISDEEVLAYYLDKHPEINACYTTNVLATKFALDHLSALDKIQEIAVVGFDGDKEILEAVKKGDIKGIIIQNPFGIGYATVVAAARTVLHMGNEAKVDTGYVWVTAENIKDEFIQSMIY